MTTVTEHLRARLLAPVEIADRACAGVAESADPWTRVGRRAYELDGALALKGEPDAPPVLSSFDPDAPGEALYDLSADVDQYTLLRRIIDDARKVKLGQPWTGLPTKLMARAFARDQRDAAAEVTATSAARHSYGRVSRSGK